MISAQEALKRLREGNKRFVTGASNLDAPELQKRRNELVSGQQPFAIILGCSDSRVPVELIFDQGLGDLFVIRVAGNIVDPTVTGSIEYAAANCGSRLVVVLGHTQCGAVGATLQEVQRPSKNPSKNLGAIVNRIRRPVEELLDTDLKNDPNALYRQAVRNNVRFSVNELLHESPILKDLSENDGLLIVGAEYSLETGKVDFFEDGK